VNGDSDSFVRLSGHVREISYSYYISKFRKKKLPNIDDADDLTNTVYLAFAEQYNSIENIEKWLRRVLFLTYVRWYKRSRARVAYELRENIPSPDVVTESSDLIDADTAISVLETLSEEKQEIVRLRLWGDLKFSEIADRLNKNEAAIKKMFYRTLLEIKERLE